MRQLRFGSRVRFTTSVERPPYFVVPCGTTGTINAITEDWISVRLDVPIRGAEPWGNCVHFYDAAADGAGDPDGWDHFIERIEFVEP
jgi:hypothetical protein